MRVVQTIINEAAHKLLEEYARRNSKTIKAVLREAVQRTVDGDVKRNDPVFTGQPASKRTGKKDHGSVEHDKYVHGEKD